MEKFKEKFESPKEKNQVKFNLKLIILVLIFMLLINGIGIYKKNMVSSNLQFSRVEQGIIDEGESIPQTLEIAQDISKYINTEDKILVQQDIYTSIQNSSQNRKKEALSIIVPDMEGQYPEDIKVIVNGTKLAKEQIKYDNSSGNLIINNNIEGTILGTSKTEYDIVYLYAKNDVVSDNGKVFTLNTKAASLLNNDKIIEQEDICDIETGEKGAIADIQKELSGEIYKGYMYANTPREVSYSETNKVRISKADEVDTLNITDEGTSFVDIDNRLYDTGTNVIYKSTSINKEQLSRLFGEDYEIIIETSKQNEENEQEENQPSESEQAEEENQGNEKIVITKETEANEDGDIVINYENEVYYTKIITNKPINEGHLVIKNVKVIKGNGDYDKEQLKPINGLITSSNVLERENNANSVAEIELKEPKAEARISVNPKDLLIIDENKDVQILALLKTDNEECELYKNPYLEVKLPEDTKEATINSIDLLYNDDSLQIADSQYVQEEKVLKIQLQGEQTEYKSEMEEGILVKINLDIEFKQDIPSKETQFVLTYRNENVGDGIYETTDNIKLNTKSGTTLYNNVDGYNEENEKIETIEDNVVAANLTDNMQEMQPTVHQSFINNYDKPLENVTIIGTLKNEDIEEEKINITLATPISTNKENAVIYYSNKENITAGDESWVEDISQLDEVKSYKIELNENLEAYEKVDMDYNLRIPEGLEKGEKSNYQTEATYLYEGMEQNNIAATLFQTPDVTQAISLDNGLTVEYLAKSAGQNIKAGDEIYDGQAIEYKVTVTNNTGNDLSNIQLTAKHTNAIYYVEKEYTPEIPTGTDTNDIITEKDYEAQEIEKTLDSLPNNESATFYYIIATNGNSGDEVSGRITVKANELEEPEEITTDTYKIKDSKLIVDIENEIGENIQICPGDSIGYRITVSNNTDTTLEDITLKIYHSKNQVLEIEDKMKQLLNIISEEEDCVTIAIDKIYVGQDFACNLMFKQKEMENGNASVSAVATIGEETYSSRELERTIEKVIADLEGEQFLKAEQKVVQEGDKLIYTARITNNDSKLVAKDMWLRHSVTQVNAQIDSAYLITNSETIDADLDSTSRASIVYDLQPGETVEYTANATICDNPSSWYEPRDDVVSSISLNWSTGGFMALNDVSTPYEKTNNGGNSEGDPSYTPGGEDDPSGETNAEKHSISGMAWLDANKDGKRDSAEKSIPNIEVSLLNAETGDSVATVKTSSAGAYKFESIEQGKYVVSFVYDTNAYSPTQYKANGVSESENSDIIQKDAQGSSKATTDVITLSNSDIANIDAGFKQNSKFDLSLNKAITKITVKNGEGTKEQKYNKEKMAKSEIHAKQVDNSVTSIEYVIEVKNEGEIPGFVSDIKDYMPKDIEFNEKDNAGWKLDNDGTLHNTSLANTKLEAGQTKELKLVLTKKGTGQIKNTAEIAEATNEYSLKDEDSTPNNNNKNEDDISTAEVILSVKTGLLETLLGVTIGVAILIVIATYIFYKRRKEV